MLVKATEILFSYFKTLDNTLYFTYFIENTKNTLWTFLGFFILSLCALFTIFSMVS